MDERKTCSDFRREVFDILYDAKTLMADHENIRCDDDQYYDPEEDWLSPLIEKLEETLHLLDTV